MHLTHLLILATLAAGPTRPPAAPLVTVTEAAQVPPIVNPNGVTFTASPDHATVENGVNLVTKYTLDLFTAAAPTVVVKGAVDLGKPAPDASNTITWLQLAAVRATLAPTSYVAAICAEGPGGRTCSVLSDPFTVTPRAGAATGKPVWKQ